MCGGGTDVRAYWGGTTCIQGLENADIASQPGLLQNYPNPFNPRTRIGFQISALEVSFVEVSDVMGREVLTLVNEEMRAGTFERTFDAANFAGGGYLYRLAA